MSIEYAKEWTFWFDRGYDYYLASRVCFLKDITRPTYFCMYQMIENLLKAVIIKNDREEDVWGHDLKKLYKRCNQITEGIKEVFKERFWEDCEKFQQDARYPSKTNYLHNELLLNSIDNIFYNLFAAFECNLKEAKRVIDDIKTEKSALVEGNECFDLIKKRYNL